MDLMHLRITGDLYQCADSENQLDAASERIQNSPHHNMEPT